MSKVNDFTAIVAVGGTGSRLYQSLATKSSLSKSFLPIAGRPAVYWTLLNLRRAGVSRVIICGPGDLTRVSIIARGLAFDLVHCMQDEGRGFHGLPVFVSRYFRGKFFLVPGHCAASPTVYWHLSRTMRPGALVTLLYRGEAADPSSRTTVSARANGVGVIAAPYAADETYLSSIERSQFSIVDAVRRYESEGTFRTVETASPIEFDVAVEMVQLETFVRRRQLGNSAVASIVSSES